MKNISKFVLSFAAAAMVAGPALAQETLSESQMPNVSLRSDVLAVVTVRDEAGKEKSVLKEPGDLTPGTKLSFGMTYTNSGSEAATNVQGTSPIHQAVRLAPSADPSLIVSVDDGKSFGTLESLSVTTDDGSSRPAAHSDVTHVRWLIESIAPGETGRIGFPVIIR